MNDDWIMAGSRPQDDNVSDIVEERKISAEEETFRSNKEAEKRK
jgi:hypothetical protein